MEARGPGRPGGAGDEAVADDRGAAPGPVVPAQPEVPPTDPRPIPPPGPRGSRPLVQHPERERTPGAAPRLPIPHPRIRQRRPWMDPSLRPLRSAVAVEEAGVGEAAVALVLPTRAVRRRTVPTRKMMEAETPRATWWIVRHRPAATAAARRPPLGRPATGSRGGLRSTPAPMTRRRSIPPLTPNAKTRSPTAHSRRPVRGSAGVGGAPAPPNGRPALRAPESRTLPRSLRRRTGPAPGRTRSRSRPGGQREGRVQAARAQVASAEAVAAARTRSSCRGSPTRSW